MKKIYLFILSVFILSTLSFQSAFATSETPPVSSFSDIVALFVKAAKWMYSIFFVVAVLYILLAAFTYMTAGDKSENVAKATKMLRNAVIAIIVVMVSGGLALIINNFLTSS